MMIRTATHTDIPDLMRIRAAVQENRLNDPSRVPTSAYEEFMSVSRIWLYQDEGGIHGFAAADPRDGSIWALFTDPAAEGRGIGKALLPHALDDLRAAGWNTATLSTGPNTRADEFYRRQGWQPTELTEGGEQGFTKPI